MEEPTVQERHRIAENLERHTQVAKKAWLNSLMSLDDLRLLEATLNTLSERVGGDQTEYVKTLEAAYTQVKIGFNTMVDANEQLRQELEVVTRRFNNAKDVIKRHGLEDKVHGDDLG